MQGDRENPGRDRDDPGRLRIGALSRRVGVSVGVLRAWERRYGLLSPPRSAGGYRLYDDEDVRRVLRMLDHLSAGVAAAEAAQITRTELEGGAAESRQDVTAPGALGDGLRRALDELDEEGAHAALDRLLSTFALETVLRDSVLPYLRDLGERWQRGEAMIAQEHFSSALLRGRLLGLARGWGSGGGPLGLLACVPGDQHDLGLICFGLGLRGNGWRITFLGPDTPLEAVTRTARLLRPALVVLTASLASQTRNSMDGLAEVAGSAPLALAGGGTSAGLAEAVGAVHLHEDPMTAAARISVGSDTDPTTLRGSNAGSPRRQEGPHEH